MEEKMRNSLLTQPARVIRGLAAGAAVILTAACATQAKSATEPPAPQVAVVAAQQRSVPLESTYTGGDTISRPWSEVREDLLTRLRNAR
jgi:hypothetical protein